MDVFIGACKIAVGFDIMDAVFCRQVTHVTTMMTTTESQTRATTVDWLGTQINSTKTVSNLG